MTFDKIIVTATADCPSGFFSEKDHLSNHMTEQQWNSLSDLERGPKLKEIAVKLLADVFDIYGTYSYEDIK